MDVYKIDEGPLAGMFIIAEWNDRNSNYVANMTSQARRMTGCSQVFARTLAEVAASPNVRTYHRLSDANKALQKK